VRAVVVPVGTVLVIGSESWTQFGGPATAIVARAIIGPAGAFFGTVGQRGFVCAARQDEALVELGERNGLRNEP
jgi:hypothetical protein